MTHIMLDLETWGKHPGCDLRSIGAVVFNPVAGWVHGGLDGGQFYIAADNPETDESGGYFAGFDDNYHRVYRRYPLSRDPETVKWWNDQSKAAQSAFANPVDLKIALMRFGDWFNSLATTQLLSLPPKPKTDGIRIWANDPHFDVSILDAAYRVVGLPVPWHHRSPRSQKTITEAAGMTRDDYATHGEAHNALDDAIAQAMTVCKAYKRLGLQHG